MSTSVIIPTTGNGRKDSKRSRIYRCYTHLKASSRFRVTIHEFISGRNRGIKGPGKVSLTHQKSRWQAQLTLPRPFALDATEILHSRSREWPRWSQFSLAHLPKSKVRSSCLRSDQILNRPGFSHSTGPRLASTWWRIRNWAWVC